jgi:hypothetical protein
MKRISERVTDWLWFGHCPVCQAVPGSACLNQAQRLTATIRGQDSLYRPHDGREKLAERIIPFLSDEAREAAPELLAWMEAHIATGSTTWAGARSVERAEQFRQVAWGLRRALTAVRTTRADPYWPDRAASDA